MLPSNSGKAAEAVGYPAATPPGGLTIQRYRYSMFMGHTGVLHLPTRPLSAHFAHCRSV